MGYSLPRKFNSFSCSVLKFEVQELFGGLQLGLDQWLILVNLIGNP